MARAIGHSAEGLIELQKHQRELTVCDNSLVQQSAAYRQWEQKLIAAYKKYCLSHEMEMVCIMDKLEGKVIDIYEDIMCLLRERDQLRLSAEKLRDTYHTKAIDVCDRLVNDQPTERLDQKWIAATRRRLLEQMQEKVELECRTRGWCLNDVRQKLEAKTYAEYARHDADAEAKKSYVDQYTINLIGYAMRVGKFPEDMVKMMTDYQQTEIELEKKLLDNFRSMEKERLEQERVMYNCAIAGQNISKWVDEHIRRCGQWCKERERLYYAIYDKRRKNANMQSSAEVMMNALYAGRDDFIIKQMSYVKHIVLRAKREREWMHTKTLVLLSKPKLSKFANKN